MPPSSLQTTPSPRQRLVHILQTLTPTKPRSVSEPALHTTQTSTPTPPIPGPNTWKALPPLPPLDTTIPTDPSPVTPQSVRALHSPQSFSQPLPPSLVRRPESPRAREVATEAPAQVDPPPTRNSDPEAGVGAWWKPPSSHSPVSPISPTSSPTTAAQTEGKRKKALNLALEELRAFVEMADGEADAGAGDAVRYAARLVERAVDVCEGCGMG